MRAFRAKSTAEQAKSEVEPGYSGDGLSMFTHRAAKSKQPRPSAAARPATVRDLIRIEEDKLRKLYAAHRAGIADPVRLARVRNSIDIEQVFIARLYVELGAEMRKGRA
jgi:hypothetical protein